MFFNRCHLSRSIVAIALSSMGAVSVASAATQVVNGFGANGWTSWDTRSSAGTQLVGTNDTNNEWTGFAGLNSTGSDTAIEKQIIFMGEGQSVNDAAGGSPPASPTGSLGGLGYVRLDGTSTGSGKSDISYEKTSGIVAASAVSDPSFSAAYTFFSQSNPTSREIGLNIAITGTDSVNYILAYTPTYNANSWNTETADGTTSTFVIHTVAGNPANGVSGTIAAFAANGTYGSLIFGSGAFVNRVGFNIGSGQSSSVNYIDSLQTSLLNGGDLIDFQAAPTPEPTSLLTLAGGAALLVVRRRRCA